MSERPVTVWLTLAQVADRLQVSARTVRREIADGRLPAARVRGIMRIGSERGRAMHREATAQERPLAHRAACGWLRVLGAGAGKR